MPGTRRRPARPDLKKGLVAVATFQHKRYPQLQLHDGKRLWAQFDGGQLETDDPDVLKRLRAATDPDLVEVVDDAPPQGKPYPGIEASADAILAWVGDDPAKARDALAAEQAAEKPRGTLLPKLDKLAGN